MAKRGKQMKNLLLIGLFAAILAFIWGNSLRDIPSSRAESLWVMEILTPLLEPIVGEGNVTNHLVRKMAHFAEFFALGCVLSAITMDKKKHTGKQFLLCAVLGLAAAGMDETIQIFSHRGSQVQDVLLDFVGAICGISVMWLFCSLMHRRKKRTH